MDKPTSCVVPGCTQKPSNKWTTSQGMCVQHYSERGVSPCKQDECEKPSQSLGYCHKHYSRFKKYGSADDSALTRATNTGPCSVDGCDNPMRKRTWCATHYSQWRRLGEVKPLSRKWTPKGTPCALCGGEVPEAYGMRKFCSQSCQVAAFRYNNNRPTEATCVACEKPFSLARRDGRLQRTDTKWCRDCRRTKSEARRYVHYGVTQKWYIDQVANGCSICGVTDRTFHVDHDHRCCPGRRSCGECVRGLLCNQCNQALGLFGDSSDVLSKAIEYLNN